MGDGVHPRHGHRRSTADRRHHHHPRGPGGGSRAPSGRPSRPTPALRRAQLARMRRRATGLLVVATAVLRRAPAVGAGDGAGPGYAIAAVEAAMVGGLADWFAVTALFRHPLGMPIPHTAVIPERKDQFGETLGDFVQQLPDPRRHRRAGAHRPGRAPAGRLAGRAGQRRAAGPPPGRGRGHRRRPAARRRGPPGAGGGGPPPHRDHAAGPAGRPGAGRS